MTFIIHHSLHRFPCRAEVGRRPEHFSTQRFSVSAFAFPPLFAFCFPNFCFSPAAFCIPRVRVAATLAMVFQLARVAEKHWRRLNGYELLSRVIAGVKFVDGVEQNPKAIAA